MTGILWNLASFIIALGVLVAVHEYGHFWVARRCGVKVHKFSIGFGKSIWKKVGKDGTEYSLSIIPLGGYVKMLDGRIDHIKEADKNQSFDSKSLWQRSAIVGAGPIFNFIFALFAYWIVFIIGVPAIKPVIGEVTPNSIVAQAGIESGMELKSIAGIKTTDWESVNMQLIAHIGDDMMTMTVAVEKGLEQAHTLDLREWQFNPDTQSPMNTLGFAPFRPEVTTKIAHVGDDGAADKAGFKIGDELLKIEDQPVLQWQQVVDAIQTNPNTPIRVLIERNGLDILLELVPEPKTLSSGEVKGFAGIAPEFGEWPKDYRFDLQYGAIESIGKAVEKTGQVISLTFNLLKKLVTGDVGIENLSGPISIAKGAGTTADYGLVYFLGFLALISINLGIINLMPLPILDGGHLLFFAVEAIIRRPVPEKIQEVGYRLGGAIIFSLMIVALFNDFTRL